MPELAKNSGNLYSKITELLKVARKNVLQTINITMAKAYFEIGKLIVEEEQNGKERAEYGKQIVQELSKKLTKEYGKGFSGTNIQQMRNFYLIYQKQQTLSANTDKKGQPNTTQLLNLINLF
jgi:hypothetical protein